MPFTTLLLRGMIAANAIMLLPFFGIAQSTTTIYGTVSDAWTGEPLVGTAIFCTSTQQGCISDTSGHYSLELPCSSDTLWLTVGYTGYLQQRIPVVTELHASRLDLLMVPDENTLNEVLISSTQGALSEKAFGTQMSVTTLSTDDIKALPALFGEVDLIKILQLKPGIIPGPEGTTGLFVRGGNSDQNLVLLDDAVLYNANHLFGFFSTFNPDATEKATVYKGGFPAQYGGRLSSVIDVKMREGNKEKIHGSGGLGLISSRLTLEGPIKKNKHSFLISGRRTYADVFTRIINRINRDDRSYNPIPDYYFYDLNSRLSFTLSDKDQLSISGYLGRDVFLYEDENFDFDFKWGNTALTAQWNRLSSDMLSINTRLTYSRYEYLITNKLDGFFFNASSGIQDVSLQSELLITPNRKHVIRTGGMLAWHQFDIARLRAGSDDGEIRFGSGQTIPSTSANLYANDEWIIGPRLTLRSGLRTSSWLNDGTFFWGLEPRIAAVYKAGEKWSLKGSYARMYQYAHLLANSGISLPTDLWYPSTKAIRPERSDQWTVGTSLLIEGGYLLTWEAWYKSMENQIDFIDGAEIFSNPDLESQLTVGRGFAYSPLELELEKQKGRLTGWVGYTLAWVRRGGFPDIDEGTYFAPRYDARHNASLVLSYALSKRWRLTSTMVYTSGYTSWLPEGRFSFFDIPGTPAQPVVPVYGERNTFRYPAYWRMDLGAVWTFKSKWAENDLTISLYNATSRRNPYFIYLDTEFETILIDDQLIDRPVAIRARQVSLFPILPSVTWNFKF